MHAGLAYFTPSTVFYSQLKPSSPATGIFHVIKSFGLIITPFSLMMKAPHVSNAELAEKLLPPSNLEAS